MIQNDTGLPHAWFRKLGPGGHSFDVLALKATFGLDPSYSTLALAGAQLPLRLSDRLVGADSSEALGLVVAEAGDAVAFKPGADVWVMGTARTENHRPQRRWDAGIGVERASHIVDLFGPREWRMGLLNWRLSEPEPCTSVAVDYRLAFGGHWSTEGAAIESLRVRKPDNPAGCG